MSAVVDLVICGAAGRMGRRIVALAVEIGSDMGVPDRQPDDHAERGQ